MISNYKITDLTKIGFPSVEVEGPSFHMNDLHEMVGRKGYMTSFFFQAKSKAYRDYGPVITGTLFNSFHTVRYLEGIDTPTEQPDLSILRIDSPDQFLSIEQKKVLKYRGVLLSDLLRISYLAYSRPIERHESGEKKIPNVVYIQTDLSKIDESKLLVNYLVSKNNSGYELISFEKEQLVGTLLGLYGRIDRRVVEHFGFTVKDIQNNVNIGFARIKAKSKRHRLTKEEEKQKEDLDFIRKSNVFIAVATELQKANLPDVVSPSARDVLKSLMDSALKFDPRILLHRKKQIYWDLNSYLHITMRHIKEFQMGNFASKTPLPYKPKDLSSLIEKVLESIADEIELHFTTQGDPFRRRGGMSIFFNGDYFNLTIDSNGRLEQFHSVGKKVD